MSEDKPPAPAAGWYPQHDGSQRYWDGTAWGEGPTPKESTPSRLARWRQRWGTLSTRVQSIVIIAVVVVGVVAASALLTYVGEQRQTAAAQEACEGYVKDSLKSPSSAEFSGTTHERTSEYGFIMRGAVDSQNGFGSMIRNDYECTINQIGDKWFLINLEFEDNS